MDTRKFFDLEPKGSIHPLLIEISPPQHSCGEITDGIAMSTTKDKICFVVSFSKLKEAINPIERIRNESTQ